MKRLHALIAVLALALALVVTPATVAPQQNAAEASSCRITYILCGAVTNHPQSHASLRVTYNWGNQWSSTGFVAPGKRSPTARDADGYWIPRGFKAWHVSKYSGARTSPVRNGPQWVKVNDIEHPLVALRRR